MPSPILQVQNGHVVLPDPTIVLPHPVAAWSLLTVFAVSAGSIVSGTLSDSQLNPWSPQMTNNGFPVYVTPGNTLLWYAKRCAPGSTTISLADSGLIDGDSYVVLEIAGWADIETVLNLGGDPPVYDSNELVISFWTGVDGGSITGWASGPESIPITGGSFNSFGAWGASNNAHPQIPLVAQYSIAPTPGDYTSTVIGPTGTSTIIGIFRPAPFVSPVSGSEIVPGFALAATYTPNGDTGLNSNISFVAAPNPVGAEIAVDILWVATSVAAISISGTNGTDTIDTGILAILGNGIYTIPDGLHADISLTCTGYDIHNTVISSQVLDIIVN